MAKKRIPLFDLKLPRSTIHQVSKTLESGWLTTGKNARQFEAELASYLGVRHAAAVNSATAGLYLALQIMGAGGREVITTPFTFVATAEAILQVGAVPIFADIDPETLLIDPDEVLRKVNERTVCVLPVDIAGHPADYARLKRICGEVQVPIVSDASHALGASYRGKSVPKFADIAVYSFHATKNLTCAEGGLVASRHKAVVEKIRLLARHAMTSNAYQRRQKGVSRYDVVDLGYKGNLSDIHAAIGLGQFARFDSNQLKRTRIADRYMRNLSQFEEFLLLPVVRPKVVHAWHLFIVRLRTSRLRITRNRFIQLMAERGVECGLHYRPIYELSFYKQLGLSGRFFPNTAYAGRRVTSLPLYPELRLKDVDYVCECIGDIIRLHRR
jgi:dTDP-4-amino-4,6-dideoxygalactose transaminase